MGFGAGDVVGATAAGCGADGTEATDRGGVTTGCATAGAAGIACRTGCMGGGGTTAAGITAPPPVCASDAKVAKACWW